jgi:hypothetical protein
MHVGFGEKISEEEERRKKKAEERPSVSANAGSFKLLKFSLSTCI